jgi:hypothetical protein
MTLAWAPDADPGTLLLRWVGLVRLPLRRWPAGRRRRPRRLLRLSVPLVLVMITVLCWTAST